MTEPSELSAEAPEQVEPDDEVAPTDEAEPTDEVELGEPDEPREQGEPVEFGEAGLPLRAQLEAVLLVTEEPIPVVTLAERLEVPVPTVEQTLRELAEEYVADGRGFELREVGGGWRYYTAAAAGDYVERFVLAGQTSRLSQAALETLAVVAYQQPVSRGRIAAVRGVNVDGVVRTLLTRRLIEEAGVDPEGGAMTYRTTSYFLERLGLRDLSELPPLAPLLPEADEIELT